jgi:choline dehydrogenase
MNFSQILLPHDPEFNICQFATNSTAPRKIARATREVILAAGAVHSAQLLQLSGIGPKALLQSLNIPVLVDTPGVGENFQDHIGVNCYYPCMLPPFLIQSVFSKPPSNIL